MRYSITALAALAATVSAHFNLDYPAARGFDEDLLSNFPCGSQDTVSSNRTIWPISGGEIALTMGHISTNIEVLIGFGNDVGDAFNTIIRPTFSEQGLGAFCMTGFTLPSDLNITDGTNATIQVITNGDSGTGGLFNCADITFSSTAPSPASGVCTNNTGVSVAAASSTLSPNLTSSSSSSSTSTSSSSSATTTKSAGKMVRAGFGGLAAAVGAVAFAIAL